MIAVGATLLIFGGGDLRADQHGALHERDLPDLAALDTRSWRFSSPRVEGGPAPRGGATATLVPCARGVAVLLLGGRDFRPPPPEAAWPTGGQHHGRDDAHLLALSSCADPSGQAQAEAGPRSLRVDL